jgi:hypothetical protein
MVKLFSSATRTESARLTLSVRKGGAKPSKKFDAVLSDNPRHFYAVTFAVSHATLKRRADCDSASEMVPSSFAR